MDDGNASLHALMTRLLDFGARNALVNFRGAKSSAAEVVAPDAAALFEAIDASDGAIRFEAATGDATPSRKTKGPQDEATRRADLIQRHGTHLGKHRLLFYVPDGDAKESLRKIAKRARESLEETGVNLAHLAFGLIHWKDEKGTAARAPLLLLPVEVRRSGDTFTVAPTDDDFVLNPTFAHKARAEKGCALPEHIEDEPLGDYLGRVRALVEPLGWEVEAACFLGIFSFLKINIYHDLAAHEATVLANPNVRRILRLPVEAPPPVTETADWRLENPLNALRSVVDADSSQIEAIEMAKAGRSFVLQGPPGTGKSQTITNIIAECLGDGKRVLFVSEKQAALNVVHGKLSQAGLADFCLALHSHKANKKAVIDELCAALRAAKTQVAQSAQSILRDLAESQRTLDGYAEALTRPRLGKRSLYALLDAYARVRDLPDIPWPNAAISQRDGAFLDEAETLLQAYSGFTPTLGADYRAYPWWGFRGDDTDHDARQALGEALGRLREAFRALADIGQTLRERYALAAPTAKDAPLWRDLLATLAQAADLPPTLLATEDLPAALRHACRARDAAATLRATQAACQKEGLRFPEEPSERRAIRFGRARLESAYANPVKRLFAHLFDAYYKGMLRRLSACTPDQHPVSHAEALRIAHLCDTLDAASETFHDARKALAACLLTEPPGPEADWARLCAEWEPLGRAAEAGLDLKPLAALTDLAAERETFAALAERLGDCAGRLAEPLAQIAPAFDAACFDFATADASDAAAKCEGCLRELEALYRWKTFRDTTLAQLRAADLLPFLDAALDRGLTPDLLPTAFRRHFLHRWIDHLLNTDATLLGAVREALTRARECFCRADEAHLLINRATLQATLSQCRPNCDHAIAGSPIATLLREGAKSRRRMSVRALLRETGALVQTLKPCFLMSPLSVSTYLDEGAVRFDTVIFDEASQIFPEDAIGAICRADQLIVVGDNRQMPPTSFFKSFVEAEEGEASDAGDFESVLDLCATFLPTLSLRWHYRSRNEALIAFSNAAFYGGRLVTFPSAHPDRPGFGVGYEPVEGLFDRATHTNRAEAERVVDLVAEHLARTPTRSLGVVAFSVAQQELIERLIDRRRQEDPAFDAALRQNEEGQSEEDAAPFFVKNLETVQGDERDVILFSVAYGPDKTGRLLHNFGPLNNEGGERRLNVAITRAKERIVVIASIHAADIDLSRSKAEGVRLLRAYLDFAEHSVAALPQTQPSPATAEPPEAGGFAREVADCLREAGFAVEEQVGCSSFRIDLAVRAPDGDGALAVECDGVAAAMTANARDRERLRRSVLEGLGWRVHRVSSVDWFRHPAAEREALLQAARAAMASPPPATPEQRPDEAPPDFAEPLAPSPAEDFPLHTEADLAAAEASAKTFTAFLKEVLKTEGPVSEERLLRRLLRRTHYLGEPGARVSESNRAAYERLLRNATRGGVTRRGGFLALRNVSPRFHQANPACPRDIQDIAPAELADGMLTLIRQNLALPQDDLYRALAKRCGAAYVGDAIRDHFDEALDLLHGTCVSRDEDGTLTAHQA